ncbi:MAG TPA: ABC transporter substrate-binding protein, partial [Stenomitos sp.]
PQWRSRFLTKPDHATYYVGMNNRIKPFDNPLVRQAVAMAIDKKRLVRLVNGRGVPARGFLPPTLPGANPQVQGAPYDPARAKALLARARYPHGFATTYWCSNAQTSLKIAQSIQYDLSRIGIQATLRPLAFPVFLSAVGREGNVPIFTGNWSQDFPDPSNFLGTIFSSRAIRPVNSLDTTFFSNAQVDRLLDTAARTMPEPSRFGLYRQTEQLILELSPVVPLFHPKRYALAQPGVKGLELHPVWPVDAERIEVTR